jgi:putative ABC transport system substrate-binding protein
VEGRNLVIEEHWLFGDVERAPQLAATLVEHKPDVILASTSTNVEAVRKLTATIPIVFAMHADPVGVGHVASLARPGGNITGVSQLMTDVTPKMLEVLHETLPLATRIGVLWNPTTPSHLPALKSIAAAAEQLKLQAVMVEARTAADLPRAFAALADGRAQALVVVSSPLSFQERARIAELCLAQRLPAIFGFRQNVQAGGLLSYGVELGEQLARAATYVDRVLRGARPAELPVEQATKFHLTVNQKTARAMGVTIPQRVLVRAGQVIE